MDTILKDFLEKVGEGQSNVLNVIRQMSPKGEQAELVLTKKQVMPDRMESPPRCHAFYEVEGFVGYLEKNKTKDTIIMADVKSSVIVAILDEKNKFGFEMIYLRPTRTPEFTLLSKMLDQEFPIERFASLAMRNRRVLGENEEAGRDFAMLMQQITISSKVTACIGSGSKSTNGLMCSTEVKAGVEGSSTTIDLPDSIKARVALFCGRPERTFDIDLTILASQQRANIVADAPELEVLFNEETSLMAAEVSDALGEDIQTAAGQVLFGEWKYNGR